MNSTASSNQKKGKTYEEQLGDWINIEKAAIELIQITGNLFFDKSVELILFRNQMVDNSASGIINLHQYAKNIVKKPITVFDSLPIAKEMAKLDLAPSRIDLGRLAFEFVNEKDNYKGDVAKFVGDKMKDFIGEDKKVMVPKDVVLYGFGRIGRLLARELAVQAGKGEQLRLRAIVTRDKSPEDITKRADLLRTDSVHGPFAGSVIEDLENSALIINGHTVHMISAKNPEDIDYTAYGINDALLIDNTGMARDREGLGKHLLAKGIGKVLLTAPGKGDIPNVVYGINQANSEANETIFSAASCTTNAIVPVLYVIDKALGIERGHVETIHS